MALDSYENFVSAQYLRNELMNLTKFCICIDIDNVKVGIVMHQFEQIFNRVMTLDSCPNFICAQYLKNKFMVFDQILLTRSRLRLLHIIL